MFPRSPMTRLVARRALRTVLGLLLLIEAIFISDIFTSQLEQVISNGGGATDLLVILLLRSPEVVDFALPIVLFLGLYLAITKARDEHELVICAAAGEPWQKIPRLALTAGVLAMAVSLLFSGALTPVSSYFARLSGYQLQMARVVEEINAPGLSPRIRTIEGRTIFTSPVADDSARRGRLFVYHPDLGEGWRVSQADDWDVLGPLENGSYQLQLKRFREYRGETGAAPTDRTAASGLRAAPVETALDFAKVRVQEVEMDFRLTDILRAVDRQRRFGERLLFQPDGPLSGPVIEAADGRVLSAPTRRFGEMLARALMCPVAAALALAAAGFAGTRRGRWLALPVGVVALMAGDVASRALLGDAAMLGYARFWAAAAAVAALGLAPALGYAWLRGELIVAPPRNQT